MANRRQGSGFSSATPCVLKGVAVAFSDGLPAIRLNGVRQE
jgi:hypothetical protein